MTDVRSEKFVLKTLPGYFFKNQKLTSLVTANASSELVEKLKKILPRLNVSTKKFNAAAGLYICDHFKSRVITQAEILGLTQKVSEGGIIFIVSHRDWGVKRLVADLVKNFGEENVEVLERGMAGYRLLGLRSKIISLENIADTKIKVDFSVKTPNGKEINLTLGSDQSLFSAKSLDEGTRLLLETVDFTKYRKILEIGCGWGPIGLTALVSNPKAQVIMTDTDPRAVDVAQQNLKDQQMTDRGRVVLIANPKEIEGRFDLIVSNPPYHQSNDELITLFTAAKEKLAAEGEIIIGTDKTYAPKFQKILETLGFSVKQLAFKGKYQVYKSTR